MASITDVANKAGVSVKTVSRIMNGFEGVSERTKAKVHKAMQELEYYPSAAAQALRGKDSGIVSLITENLTTTPDSFEIVAGIQSVCEANGMLLLIGETGGKKASFEKLVEDFRRQRSQAIIYATVFHKEVSIEQKFEHCPLILVNCYEKETRHSTILPDDEMGAFTATKKLIEAGHSNIAFLTLFDDMRATKLRLAGYKRAFEEHDLPINEKFIKQGVARDPEDEFSSLEFKLRELLSYAERPTAIMCGNDKMAMRVYMLVRGVLGYQIPEQISVVGYDNYHMIADNLVPKLSTVSLPYFKMGEMAAQQAIAQSQNNKIHKLAGEFISRQSTRVIDE